MSSPKKRKNQQPRDVESQSDSSFRLQKKASKSTENIFSQMLSHSKKYFRLSAQNYYYSRPLIFYF